MLDVMCVIYLCLMMGFMWFIICVYWVLLLVFGFMGVDCVGGVLVGFMYLVKMDDVNNKVESFKCIDGFLFLVINIGFEGV